MAWVLVPGGSWGSATTDNPPTDLPPVLARPGSWQMARARAMVRRDSWPLLRPLGPPPSIQSVLPGQGPAAGGTQTAVLCDTPAEDATAVTFGGVPGTDFSVANPVQIRATSPPGPPDQLVDVLLLTPRGPSNAVQFYYLATEEG